MSLSLLIPLAGFALVATITPGPNNLMLLASGASFGFRKTAPHMLGIAIGLCAMILLVGLGLGQIFAAFPALATLLRVVGITYLLWLAWKIAHSVPASPGETAGRPLTFFQAAAFQWVNPKAWTMVLTAITVYAPGTSLWAILAVVAVFAIVCLPSIGCWAMLGDRMRWLMRDPQILRRFNWVMAGLLVVTAVPALFL